MAAPAVSTSAYRRIWYRSGVGGTTRTGTAPPRRLQPPPATPQGLAVAHAEPRARPRAPSAQGCTVRECAGHGPERPARDRCGTDVVNALCTSRRHTPSEQARSYFANTPPRGPSEIRAHWLAEQKGRTGHEAGSSRVRGSLGPQARCLAPGGQVHQGGMGEVRPCAEGAAVAAGRPLGPVATLCPGRAPRARGPGSEGWARRSAGPLSWSGVSDGPGPERSEHPLGRGWWSGRSCSLRTVARCSALEKAPVGRHRQE